MGWGCACFHPCSFRTRMRRSRVVRETSPVPGGAGTLCLVFLPSAADAGRHCGLAGTAVGDRAHPSEQPLRLNRVEPRFDAPIIAAKRLCIARNERKCHHACSPNPLQSSPERRSYRHRSQSRACSRQETTLPHTYPAASAQCRKNRRLQCQRATRS
jgi:hypothetical protein